MPACDICTTPMEWGQGYGLNTTQVTTSEAFWEYILTSPWSFSHQKDPQGKGLGNLTTKMGSQNTPWLVCDSCGEFLDFDRQIHRKYNKQGAKPPGTGAADLSEVALAAAYAWSKLYDSWPLSIQIRESPPEPSDIGTCDFCRRHTFSDEELAVMTEPAVQTYEKLGGLKRRGPASLNIKRNSFWIACSVCVQRAHRIIGEDSLPDDMNIQLLDKKKKW